MGETLNLRFRHTQGDIGPLKLPAVLRIQAVKERLVATWPKDGPLSLEPPAGPGDIKLILSGKFLDGLETLESLKAHMGELKPDTLVTLHVVVRAPKATTKVPGLTAMEEGTDLPAWKRARVQYQQDLTRQGSSAKIEDGLDSPLLCHVALLD